MPIKFRPPWAIGSPMTKFGKKESDILKLFY
jgi:hypothetical protein